MNITYKMLAIVALFIAVLFVSPAIASNDTPADVNETSDAVKSEFQINADELLKNKIEARNHVMFLAKRKFMLEEYEYNLILNDMLKYIQKEHKLEQQSLTDEEKQKILEPLKEDGETLLLRILKSDYERFLSFLKENEYIKTTGWDNVEKANGIAISILGIIYVFTGLVVMVVILNIFGRIFAQKETAAEIITIEMDNSPVRGSSKSASGRLISTVLIRKDLMKKREEEEKERLKAEEVRIEEARICKAREQELKEIAVAIGMAIHAELHLFAKAEKLTVLDYPNVVSSWAFSSRPVVHSYFQKLRNK